MNKFLLLLSAFLVTVSAFIAGQLAPTTPVLGGNATGINGITEIASSTQTYFGVATGADTRPTTTVLTIFPLYQYDNVALKVEIFATTTAGNQGFTYLQPQVSNNAITWSDWLPNQQGTNGTIASTITLPAGTSTTIVIPAGGLGTTSVQYNLGTVIGRYMRVQLGSSGTSTIRVYGELQY